MNKTGFKHVRKINDGRPKPYFGRISFANEPFQTRGHPTAKEAHEAAIHLRRSLAVSRPQSGGEA